MDNKIFEKLSDIELMALCIWAEARNQGLEGIQAVGSVILNRASRPGWWGHDGIKSVILQPKQFSCLNEDDPQRVRMAMLALNFSVEVERNPDLRACFWIAKGLVEKYLTSNVGPATHYHTTAVAPAWKDKLHLIAHIKDHLFYV